jgi:hypothetical protein
MSFKREIILCCEQCARRSMPAREDSGYANIARVLQYIGWTFYNPPSDGAPLCGVDNCEHVDALNGRGVATYTDLLALCPTCTDKRGNDSPRRTVRVKLSWAESYDVQGVNIYMRVPMDAGDNDVKDALSDGYWYDLVAEQVVSFADRADEESSSRGNRKLEHRELLDVEVMDDNVAEELPEEI